MARTAFLLKLPFMDILMAINTLFSFGSILFVLMTLFTFRTFVFTYQRKFSLLVMIQCILLPVSCVVTLYAIIPEFLFMGIILFMAVIATVRQRFILSVHMAFLARRLYMLSVKPVAAVSRCIVFK